MAEVFGFNKEDASSLVLGLNNGDTVQRLNALGGATLYRFETTADFSTGTSVGAEILTMGGSVVASAGTVNDPDQIFLGIANGTKGLAIYQAGTYYIIQAACGA